MSRKGIARRARPRPAPPRRAGLDLALSPGSVAGMERKHSIDAAGAALLFGFTLLLGANQVVVKLTNAGFPPVAQAAWRSLLAVAVMARRRSVPSITLVSRSATARMSAWSANPAVGNPRLRARSWRSTDCRAATSGSTATSFPAPAKVPTRNSGPGCRWCFRIPTAPSTRATVCEGLLRNRSILSGIRRAAPSWSGGSTAH